MIFCAANFAIPAFITTTNAAFRCAEPLRAEVNFNVIGSIVEVHLD